MRSRFKKFSIRDEDACGEKTWEKFGDKQKEMFAPMISCGYRYFNAGFMLLNIKEMRKKYSFEVYTKAIEEWNYQMDAPDQDILNYVHWQHVGYIDYKEYDMFARIAHNNKMTYQQVKDDVTVEAYIENLNARIGELESQLQDSMALNQKLLAILQGSGK